VTISRDKTTIVENGYFELEIDSNTVGHTEEGCEITFAKGKVQLFSHESGEVPIKTIHNGTNITLKVKFLEITANELGWVFPEASVAVGGTTTISDHVGTDLTAGAVDINLYDNSGNKYWAFSNMVPCPDEVVIRNRIGEKWMLDAKFQSHWMDTGTRATYTPVS